MNNVLVSIIIPVYNMEKYIDRTLETLINQTTKMNYEIIVINDGSTDNSLDIIKKYEEKYSKKILVYNKENGGLSDARNFGVSKANGKYICFVDAGDYISYNLLEKLEKYIYKNIDIIKYKLVKVDENGNELSKIEGPVFDINNGMEALKKLIGNDFYLEVACIYLYKKEFWDKYNFKFALKRYHEDFGLIPWVILNANTVVSTELYGYYYVQNDNSITRNLDYNKNIKKAEDLLYHYDNIYSLMNSNEIIKNNKELILQYYTNVIILKVRELKRQEKKWYIKEIKKRKMSKNIKIKNIKQLFKRVVLGLSIKLYLKIK